MYPFVSYFARPKNAIHKYLSPVYVHLFYATIPMVQYLLKFFDILRGVEKVSFKDVMPLMEFGGFQAIKSVKCSG